MICWPLLKHQKCIDLDDTTTKCLYFVTSLFLKCDNYVTKEKYLWFDKSDNAIYYLPCAISQSCLDMLDEILSHCTSNTEMMSLCHVELSLCSKLSTCLALAAFVKEK